jgi:hypothetical protein
MADDVGFLDDIGSDKSSFSGSANPLSALFERYGKIFVDSTQRTLAQYVPDAETGKLYQSIAFDVQIVGKVWRFTIMMEDYWKFVDEGRKPGKNPPLKPIVEWINSKPSVKAKFNLTRNKQKLKRVKKLGDIKATPQVLSAAIAIQRTIGKRGTKATRFVSKNINEEVLQKIKDDIAIITSKNIKISVKQFMNAINKG